MSSSPFEHILHTNTAPSDTEMDAIRSFLGPKRTQLDEIDAEVSRLRVLLDAAKASRDNLQSLISDHEALLSPIRRMPDDILRLIFLKTLPETRNTAMAASEGPMLLVQVCIRWRELVLSTPRLWASIHLIVTPPHLPDGIPNGLTDAILAQLDRWLGLSAAAPLDISVETTREHHFLPPGLEAGIPWPFLSPLLAHSHRLRRMQLVVLQLVDFQALCQLNAADVPCLQSFGITLSTQISRETVADMELRFLSTPSLRKLSFHGTYAALPRAVRWSNIEALHLSFYTIRRQVGEAWSIPIPFAFLRDANALRFLSLHISHQHTLIDSTELDPGALIHLPSLEALSLSLSIGIPANNAEVSRNLFRRFALPALEAVDMTFFSTIDPLELLQPLAHIKRLSFFLAGTTLPRFVTILEMLSQLEYLRILEDPQPEAENQENNTLTGPTLPQTEARTHILSKLVVQPGVEPLCPSLKELEFTSTVYLEDTLILQFLRSRTRPTLVDQSVVALTGFKCNLQCKQQLDVKGEMASAIAQGLRLRLKYQEPGPHPFQFYRYSPLEGTEVDPVITSNPNYEKPDARDGFWEPARLEEF